MGASRIIIIPDLHGREFWRGAVNDIGEKRYLFSHAGIHPDWARKQSTLFGPPEKVTAETFNQLMFTPEFVDTFEEVSRDVNKRS